MYILGVISGMLLAWLWLTKLSPYAKEHTEDPTMVRVQCHYCGHMYVTSYGNVRVTNKCMSCA
jgi:ribosomal protein S27E